MAGATGAGKLSGLDGKTESQVADERLRIGGTPQRLPHYSPR